MKKYNLGASKRVENYLVEKAKNNEPIPNANRISTELGLGSSTVFYALQSLAKKNKIKYSNGKVLMVLTPQANAQFERTFKTVKHEVKVSPSDLKEKYDEVVKEIITNFIKEIPSEELTTERITQCSNSILNISNNIKNKLFS